MSEHERYEHGVGPIYSVPLIATLPLNPSNPNGMRQQMANQEDLRRVVDRVGERVVAAYEVLLHHWRCRLGEIAADNERLRTHGQRVGIDFGCDTAEHMADEIESLRQQLAAAKTETNRLRMDLAIEKAFHSDTELYHQLIRKRDEAVTGGGGK